MNDQASWMMGPVNMVRLMLRPYVAPSGTGVYIDWWLVTNMALARLVVGNQHGVGEYH